MNLPPSVVLLVLATMLCGAIAVLAWRHSQLESLVVGRLVWLKDASSHVASVLKDLSATVITRLKNSVRRRHGDNPRGLVHELVGTVMHGVFAVAVLAGDVMLLLSSVCGMISEGCGQITVPSPGLAVGLALIGASVWWGMIAMDLLRITAFSDWPKHWTFKAATGAMLLLAIAIMLGTALFRDFQWGNPTATAAQVVAGTARWRQLVLIGGALLIAVTSAFAFGALGAVVELLILALVFVPLAALLTAGWVVALAVSALADLAIGAIQDVIKLVKRSGDGPRRRPPSDSGVFAFRGNVDPTMSPFQAHGPQQPFVQLERGLNHDSGDARVETLNTSF